MLFVGLQFVVWSISGAYMVLMDIHYIHGDSLVTKDIPSINTEQVNYSINELLSEYPEAKHIKLGLLLEQAVYRFSITKQKMMISAQDGQRLADINVAAAIKIAKQHAADENAEVLATTLITKQPPGELSARHLPVWRIDFDDFASSSFYISATNGELVTKRHNFWRIFDWMFVFHVMDYVDGSAENKLLLLVTVLALFGSVFGVVLTYFRLAPTQVNKRIKR